MVRFFGQFDPPVDRVIFERYFSFGRHPGLCIECGAFDGLTESSCYFFEKYLSWSAINIEPSPAGFEQLIKNRPNSINVNIGLSDSDGSARFTLVKHPVLGDNFGNSSLSHSKEHLEELRSKNCEFSEIEIRVSSYSTLINSLNIKKVDLMVLDVEGHELSVLSGMQGCAILPEVFVVEYGHLGESNAIEAVEKLGYEFDFKSNANLFFIKTPCRPEILQSISAHQDKIAFQKLVQGSMSELSMSTRVIENNVVFVKTKVERSLFLSPRAWIKRIFTKIDLA